MNMEESTQFVEVVADATMSIVDSLNTVVVFGVGLFDFVVILFVASIMVSILKRFVFGGGSNDDRH